MRRCSTRRRSIQSADTLFSVYLPCRSQITCHSLAGCNDKTNNKNGPSVWRGGTIYRPAGGSFLGSFLGRSTGRWYPLGVSGCTAGWQRSVPAPARGRWRHLGAGCYSRVFDCIVSGRVALLLRSAEIQPLFLRFAAMSSHDMLLMHTLCFCFSRLQGKLRATARGRMGPCYMLTLLHPLGLWMLPGGCWLWVLHVF